MEKEELFNHSVLLYRSND
jgi:thioredoxin reductase